jgi:hypothetical protein
MRNEALSSERPRAFVEMRKEALSSKRPKAFIKMRNKGLSSKRPKAFIEMRNEALLSERLKASEKKCKKDVHLPRCPAKARGVALRKRCMLHHGVASVNVGGSLQHKDHMQGPVAPLRPRQWARGVPLRKKYASNSLNKYTRTIFSQSNRAHTASTNSYKESYNRSQRRTKWPGNSYKPKLHTIFAEAQTFIAFR